MSISVAEQEAVPAAEVDRFALQEELATYNRQQLAHMADPENVPPLPEDVIRRCIEINRILRRTNTGPAAGSKQRTRRSAKRVVSLDELGNL